MMTAKGLGPIDLPRFLRALEKTNPFKRDVVAGTKGAEVDVEEVHGREYLALLREIESVRNEGGAAGILLLAPAGVGKSHVLARVDRWAREDGRCTMVILYNLVATPERMPRALLGATINLLAGAREVAFAQSELYALLNYAISKLYRGRGAPSMPKRLELLRQAGARLDPQGNVLAALCAFLENTHQADHGVAGASERAQLAVEWLSGQDIDAEQGRQLGLAPLNDEISGLADGMDERVVTVLAGLSKLAGRPFILCLDQVDIIDDEGIRALCRFLHAVLDHADNLVVITSGVKASMIQLQNQRIILASTWDRIAHTRVELRMIRTEEARKIVQARVDQFMAPFESVEALAPLRRKDPLFPLPTIWVDAQLSHPELRPRDVIRLCREQWAHQQSRLTELGDADWLGKWPHPGSTDPGATADRLDKVIDDAVSMKIKECIAQRKLRPQGLPADAARFSELVARLLGYCRNRGYTMVDFDPHPQKPVGPYHLSVKERADHGEFDNGVTFVATTSKATATNALKRIVNDRKPPHHRILVTEERRRLPLGPKGQECIQSLRALEPHGFRHMELRFEDYALLDALASTAGAARVGDLEIEWPSGKSRPIREDEVVDSMHRGRWFLQHPLLAELLTEEAPPSKVPPSGHIMNPKRAQEFIVAELSWRICLTARELAEVYRQREKLPPDQLDSIWKQIKEVANALAGKGHVDVTASEDDLFLQSMGKP